MQFVDVHQAENSDLCLYKMRGTMKLLAVRVVFMVIIIKKFEICFL